MQNANFSQKLRNVLRYARLCCLHRTRTINQVIVLPASYSLPLSFSLMRSKFTSFTSMSVLQVLTEFDYNKFNCSISRAR